MRLPTLPLLLALAWPATLSAQAMVQALPGSSDADLLAATMRRVAANPLDVDALLTAGEQSLKVDDLSGAASLFARAEKIDPRNGRVKAGMASILVRSERPGEALRYFAQAEAAGLDPRRFAADRGFAYDLTGDQPRAQRDYRAAIATGADDETVRRYALSLGISGRGDEALRELQPLLGRSDRAAWRARAFILAMTGDQPGAERIAATMMPPGMAQGLRPFFARLPVLPAVDRAFAVHFGEVRPTPERIADARLAPVMAPLPAEQRPVQVAAVTATTTRQETRGERRSRERAEKRAARERVALASRTGGGRVQPGRVTLAPNTGVPAAAAVVSPPVQVAALAPNRPASIAGSLPASGGGSASLSAGAPLPQPGFTVAPTASSPITTAPVVPVVASAVPGTIQPGFTAPVTVAAAAVTPASGGAGLAPLVASPPGAAPVAVASTPTPARSVAAADTAPITRPAPGGVALAAVGGRSGARPVTTPALPRRTARTPAADSVLARIVASLSIPASELDVAAPARPQPGVGGVSEGAARTAEALRTKAARDAEADAAAQRLVRGRATDTRRGRKAAAEPVAVAAIDEVPSRTARGRGATKVVADAGAADEAPISRKADARKALADRKAAAEKKAAADKAAEEKRAERAHPSRIWVQVAGGAYAGDLPKAWTATRARAPQAFAGRSGYSAKLRATNRVVTGPFKTDAEARAFVNQLAKAGVSAFPFTSDAGESVTRLPGK